LSGGLEDTAIVAREGGLHKELTRAQIIMISLGGAIGTSLFLSSGIALGYAGPSVLVSYAIAGFFAVAMVLSLSEMAVMHPAAGEWSPEEVLAHLRAAHDITEPRILAILTRDNPPLPAFDERRWQEVACYLALPMTESLETLRLRRHELVQALHALPAAAWMRTGRHEERGPLTVLEIAQDIAFHDEEHCIQVERMTTNGGE